MKKDNSKMDNELELDEAITLLDSVELGSVLGGAFAQSLSNGQLAKASPTLLFREAAI